MRTLAIALCIGLSMIIGSSFAEYEQTNPIDVSYHTLIPEVKTQVDCLTQNIYYEAGAEITDGLLAVAMVTMNRVNDNFAPDVCSVVKQKTGSICQFSWWCEARRKIHYGNYKRAQDIAVQVYLNYGSMSDITKGATYFHEQSINPGWKNVVKTVKIGHHIFYKKKVYYVEKVKPSFEQQFRSNKELIYAFDGGYITPVMQANN